MNVLKRILNIYKFLYVTVKKGSGELVDIEFFHLLTLVFIVSSVDSSYLAHTIKIV